MTTGTTAKAPLHQRAMHELKELVFISLYLYVTLGAVILMKAAVLHTEGVQFTPWGIAIVKAVVLAKFMMLGEMHEDRWPRHHWPADLADAAEGVRLAGAADHHDHHRGSRRRPVPPPIDRRLARRPLWPSPRGNARRLPDHAGGAASRIAPSASSSEALGEGRLERMFFVNREAMARS